MNTEPAATRAQQRNMPITSIHEIEELIKSVRAASDRTVHSLRDLLAKESDSLMVLSLMKFHEIGHHPTDDRKLNLIEQLNQTFTYLVSLEAARWVLQSHPELLPAGINVNLGTAAGFDLESVEAGCLAAEVFAATHPRSNGKLKKDLTRLADNAAGYNRRYVFFSCPGFGLGRQTALESVPGIQVWSFPVEDLLEGV